jgi:GT2 family glycosyltransferase
VANFAAADARVKYVREPRPGLSRARNTALRHAAGEILAFSDDDVLVDRRWLDSILRGFARTDGVGCVTGLIASASLEHPAEQYFDGRVSWSANCEHRLFRLEPGPDDPPLHPYNAGTFGAGANMAFRTAALQQTGPFDERLGAGTPAAGGEDLDMFVRVLRAGWVIGYEPAALVWHAHRVDEQSLRGQLRAYGSGLSAYLFKHLLARATRRELLSRCLHAVRHARQLGARSQASHSSAGLPSDVARAELHGLVLGPWLYLRAPRNRRPLLDQDAPTNTVAS